MGLGSSVAPLLSLVALLGVTGAAPDPDPVLRRSGGEARPRPVPSPTAGLATGFDVDDWQALLDRYATADGGFRYAALRADAADVRRLASVVAAVGSADPSGWSRDAQLAFHVNAYNALVVSAVLAHWPLESVMRVPGFFDREAHRVAGRAMTLNALENEILRDRARFAEPRIHFAINCASASCPRLSRTAFTAENLEAQLDRQTRDFVRRHTHPDGEGLRVSAIFDWYADDFGPAGGVRAFLAPRLEGELARRARAPTTPLRFAPYDWDLNDRP